MNTIKTEMKNHVLHVTLKRPELHNAFNPEMIQELTDIFKNISDSVRCVVLRGEGKSFCAGADLNWMKSMATFNMEENLKDSQKLFEMFESVLNCKVPVITKAHGSVFGGGLGLLAASDIVLAVKETKFCFSEVKLGLVPAVISAFVKLKCQPSLSRQMMLTGQVFGEDTSVQMGLVTFVGTDEEVEDYLQSQADFISNNGPKAVRDTKSLLNHLNDASWPEAKSQTTMVISQRRVSEEGQEGLKSFFEKRKPNWRLN